MIFFKARISITIGAEATEVNDIEKQKTHEGRHITSLHFECSNLSIDLFWVLHFFEEHSSSSGYYSCFYCSTSISCWRSDTHQIVRLSSTGHLHALSSSSSHRHNYSHPHHHRSDIYSSGAGSSHHLTPPARHHPSLHHQRRASLALHDGSTRRASSPAAPRSYLEVRRGSAVPEALRRRSLAHTAPSSATVSATSSLFEIPSPSVSAIIFSTGRRKSSTRFVLHHSLET